MRTMRAINNCAVSVGRFLRLNRLGWANNIYAKVLSLACDLRLEKNQIILTEIQDGIRYHIDTNDRGSMFAMLVRGAYEPMQTELFKSCLVPGMVFADVGAHVGYYSMIAAKALGIDGRVFSFEPRGYSCELFLKNLRENGFSNVQLVRSAVTDSDGSVGFYTDSVYNIHGLSPEKENRVAAVSLSSFFSSRGIPAVDVVKMDIEGGEYLALEGMKSLLLASPDPKVFLEFNPQFYEKFGGVTVPDFWAKLRECGFVKIYAINEHLWRLEECADPAALEKRGSINLLCLKHDNPVFARYLNA